MSTMFEFAAYRQGWVHGAAARRRSHELGSRPGKLGKEYERGYEDGRLAHQAAMAAAHERMRGGGKSDG